MKRKTMIITLLFIIMTRCTTSGSEDFHRYPSHRDRKQNISIGDEERIVTLDNNNVGITALQEIKEKLVGKHNRLKFKSTSTTEKQDTDATLEELILSNSSTELNGTAKTAEKQSKDNTNALGVNNTPRNTGKEWTKHLLHLTLPDLYDTTAKKYDENKTLPDGNTLSWEWMRNNQNKFKTIELKQKTSHPPEGNTDQFTLPKQDNTTAKRNDENKNDSDEHTLSWELLKNNQNTFNVIEQKGMSYHPPKGKTVHQHQFTLPELVKSTTKINKNNHNNENMNQEGNDPNEFTSPEPKRMTTIMYRTTIKQNIPMKEIGNSDSDMGRKSTRVLHNGTILSDSADDEWDWTFPPHFGDELDVLFHDTTNSGIKYQVNHLHRGSLNDKKIITGSHKVQHDHVDDDYNDEVQLVLKSKIKHEPIPGNTEAAGHVKQAGRYLPYLKKGNYFLNDINVRGREHTTSADDIVDSTNLWKWNEFMKTFMLYEEDRKTGRHETTIPTYHKTNMRPVMEGNWKKFVHDKKIMTGRHKVQHDDDNVKQEALTQKLQHKPILVNTEAAGTNYENHNTKSQQDTTLHIKNNNFGLSNTRTLRYNVEHTTRSTSSMSQEETECDEESTDAYIVMTVVGDTLKGNENHPINEIIQRMLNASKSMKSKQNSMSKLKQESNMHFMSNSKINPTQFDDENVEYLILHYDDLDNTTKKNYLIPYNKPTTTPMPVDNSSLLSTQESKDIVQYDYIMNYDDFNWNNQRFISAQNSGAKKNDKCKKSELPASELLQAIINTSHRDGKVGYHSHEGAEINKNSSTETLTTTQNHEYIPY